MPHPANNDPHRAAAEAEIERRSCVMARASLEAQLRDEDPPPAEEPEPQQPPRGIVAAEQVWKLPLRHAVDPRPPVVVQRLEDR